MPELMPDLLPERETVTEVLLAERDRERRR